MNQIELKGQGKQSIRFSGNHLATVEALNHDNSVRCEMHLYKANSGYICQRVDRPGTLDVRYRLEVCDDTLCVYQFFGTEPLANYLCGIVGFSVPGMRRTQKMA